MAAALTTFRQALQTQLQTQLGVEFFGGIITGPQQDRTVGCCWTANLAPADDNEFVAGVDVRARVLLRTPQAQEEFSARDPAALEALAESMAVALKAVKATLGGAWYFTVRNLELDLEENGVEATLIVYRDNPAA